MNTCEHCGKVISRKHARRANRFCSQACYFASGPRGNYVEKTASARMKRASNHPLAPPSGVVAVCRIVLYEKIGSGSHPCNWCGRALFWKPGEGLTNDAIMADHLDFDMHNDVPENLVPSCRTCNVHRLIDGRQKLIEDDEVVVINANGTRTRGIERSCIICGEKFIARLSQVKLGRATCCSRSCARRLPRSAHS